MAITAPSPPTVDLAADAGEAFGPWPMGDDAALFAHLSSAHVACGVHAGDPSTMRRTARLAREAGVAVGAHPGYPDRVGFGRRALAMTPAEIHDAVLYQLGALAGVLAAEDLALHHVKPHGALHHRTAADADAADALARAVATFDASLPLVVLAGPGGDVQRTAAHAAGLPTAEEGFPDRGYLADGRLAPRGTDGALIHDPATAAARARAMVHGTPFAAVDGGDVTVRAATLCIHGDGPTAPAIARAIRAALDADGVAVRPV